MNSVIGLYRLIRFELSFTAGMCVVLGEILALSEFPSFTQAGLGFVSVFCIAATALILNDYFDVETDRINAPSRPLPSGLVTANEALVFSVVIAFAGFIASWLISTDAFFTVCLVWLIGFLYNWKFKKTGLLGNLFVGFSVGMTFIFGGIVVGRPFNASVWYFAVTTLLVDLAEEIAADSLDVEGDRMTGSRSLAVLFGPVVSMRISAGIFWIVITGSTVPFIFGWFDWFYAPLIFLWDSVIIYSVWNLLDAAKPRRIDDIRRIYVSGLIMILGFIILNIIS